MNQWSVTRYLAAALDPIHVGAGGQRLGRVDMTVIREPITNVPKLPGTSLSGAIKFFLDLSLRARNAKTNTCASTTGSDKGNRHDRSTCPVCALFGYTAVADNDDELKSAQGILQFSDATLLAYPVNTVMGPVWITTAPRLKAFCNVGAGEDNLDENYALVSQNQLGGDKNPLQNKLNFGWVLLTQSGDASKCPALADIAAAGIPPQYAERMVVVSEWVFAQLVNSNMEVRTSVVIDPDTGAADDKGLFTYEAVARGALFCFTIAVNDYNGSWPKIALADKPGDPLALLSSDAFGGLEAVGLGGMTTRGFGRLKVMPLLSATI